MDTSPIGDPVGLISGINISEIPADQQLAARLASANINREKQIYTINLVQTKVENTPTLLKISPSIVFLNSKNPKQKITVMSLYEGAYKDYYITNTLSNTHSELITTNDEKRSQEIVELFEGVDLFEKRSS